MKKAICILCIFLIFLQSFAVVAETTEVSYTATSEAAAANARAARAQQQANDQARAGGEPTQVTHQADGGADYSEGAGNHATQVDMAIDMTTTAIALAALLGFDVLGELWQQLKKFLTNYQCSWGSIGIMLNVMGLLTSLAHAAVNKFMRDTWYITASFTGTQGHVTDRWIGAGPKKVEIAILKEFEVPTQRFAAIAFDANEYKGLKDVGENEDARNASARKLMEYRNKTLIEEQRSLENVTQETWGIHYRAQRRAITALAAALKMKETLAVLAKADARISANYDSKTDAVATVAARRVLYDALMFLKMNVMAARTKTRSEATELDFEPVTTDPEGTEPGTN